MVRSGEGEEELLILIIFCLKSKQRINTEDCINIILLLWFKQTYREKQTNKGFGIISICFFPVRVFVIYCYATSYPQAWHKITPCYYLIFFFYGSRIWGPYLGALAQGLSQAGIEMLAGAGASSEGSTVEEACPWSRPWLLAGFSSSRAVGQRPSSVPCQMGLCTGQLTARQVASLRESEQAREWGTVSKVKPESFCNWISEITSPHICHVLFIAECH